MKLSMMQFTIVGYAGHDDPDPGEKNQREVIIVERTTMKNKDELLEIFHRRYQQRGFRNTVFWIESKKVIEVEVDEKGE